MTRSDELSVAWIGVDGRNRCWTFISDSIGQEGWGIEGRWTSTGWLEVGRESVSLLHLEGASLEA